MLSDVLTETICKLNYFISSSKYTNVYTGDILEEIIVLQKRMVDLKVKLSVDVEIPKETVLLQPSFGSSVRCDALL